MQLFELKNTIAKIKNSVGGLNNRREGQAKESVNWKTEPQKII